MDGDSEEWIVVTKKRKGIQKNQKKKKGEIVWEAGRPIYSQQHSQADVEEYCKSESFTQNKKLIKQFLQKAKSQREFQNVHIQCLGLGDFIKYTKSRYQFNMLNHLIVPLCQTFSQRPITINIYDPIFTDECKEEVLKIGSCCSSWCEAKPNQLSLYFMPHGQRFMYEKICENEELSGSLVIGNSIMEYIQRCQLIQEKIPAAFLPKQGQLKQVKVLDFRESLNDTFIYFI